MFPRLRLLSSALLLVLTTACSRQQEPAPEPVLEGTWHEVNLTTYRYDAGGNPLAQTRDEYRQADGSYPHYLAVTGSTLQRFRADGTPVAAPLAYTRAGTALTVPDQTPQVILPGHTPQLATATITQLTHTELTIRYKYRPGSWFNDGWLEEGHYYIRR